MIASERPVLRDLALWGERFERSDHIHCCKVLEVDLCPVASLYSNAIDVGVHTLPVAGASRTGCSRFASLPATRSPRTLKVRIFARYTKRRFQMSLGNGNTVCGATTSSASRRPKETICSFMKVCANEVRRNC